MDNSDTPKARRPLPTPGLSVPQRSNTPVLSPSPVPAASLHGSQKPPPLPSRPKNPGSNHTAYIPPPNYGSPTFNGPPGFREPELITEGATQEDDDMVPDLLPPTEDHWADDTNQDTAKMYENWHEPAPGWDANWTSGGNTGTAAGFESMDYMTSNRMDHDFIIDGRITHEETHWWNPELRERNKRPGPGVLAPVLAEELHDSNHSLFSVNIITLPLIAPLPPVPNSKDNAAVPPTPSSSSSLQHSVDHSPPTEEEVRTSVPHPNAYYCPKDNGWVILSWKVSSVAPPLAKSYIVSGGPPLPDQARRRRVSSCIEEDQPFGKANKTHHFHKYEKAVDSHRLTPPFRKDEWESIETVKQRRRAGTIMTTDLNINMIKADGMDTLGDNEVESAEEEGKLLDLYVCCQCSFYCVASGVIPGVIPRKRLEELIRDKKGHPVVGKSAEESIVLAFDTFLM